MWSGSEVLTGGKVSTKTGSGRVWQNTALLVYMTDERIN
jgi:hypothetical protein